MGPARTRPGRRDLRRPAAPVTAADVGLVVASAMAPGTFAPSLSSRSALDQGLVTGLATGLHYLLAAEAQDALEATARFLVDGDAFSAARRRGRIAVDCAAVPIGLAVLRVLPPRTDAPLRGAVRQAAWRLGATGLCGAVLTTAELAVQRLDDRLGLGGHLAGAPLAVPVGLGVAYVTDRLHRQGDGHATDSAEEGHRASQVSSMAIATGVVGGLSGAAYGEHRLVDLAARRLAAVLPGPPELWRLAGHAVALVGVGVGATAFWHRAMRRIEAGTSADVPVVESGEAERWVPPSVSGGPGSLVPWSSLGREGRRHALASVRPRPLEPRPDGVPDLSIETVMEQPARATPVQVYVGLDSATTARERVDLAMAELERTGALDRSLLVLISPTGTGYVNYVAEAGVQYLSLGDVATVTLQYSRRPSPLSLGMIGGAREQNRLLWLRILQNVRSRRSRPRVVLFGESLGAHTSQDVFLHWGTLGLDALGVDRALWIGTPYGSKWMQQVTGAERLDVDRSELAVVNDHEQLRDIVGQRGTVPRFVLLSHDNDGVTKFGPQLLWSPPDWLGPGRPRVEEVDDASPRGIPPAMRWRPLTTFFQSLVDMKNAQVPGAYRAWAHDYRTDLPRFLSTVYGLPATPDQLARIEEALQVRETVRERLFATTPAG